jgi:hypothetical protein
MSNDNTILKRALAANAVFSATTGLGALTLAAGPAESLGPPAWALRTLGAGLLAFAAVVARRARRPDSAGTRQIIAADVAWVVTAAILIAVAPSWLTDDGRTVLGAVTLVVAVIAAEQWRGLKTITSSSPVRSADVEVRSATRHGV